MQNIKIKINIKNKGFSLVEMLVAVAIFMSIMTVAVSSLISIINANNKAQSIKSTIDSVTFAIENISRDMRVGSGYKCLDSSGNWNITCDLINGSKAVKYTNSSGDNIIYKFNGDTNKSLGVLTREISPCPDKADTCPVDLISQDSNVNISNMTFYVIGADCEDGGGSCANRTQPRVVITASGLISSKGSPDTSFNLQTNISQRIRR